MCRPESAKSPKPTDSNWDSGEKNGMPKAFAIQANPVDSQMAEDAAREALDNVYRMIQKNVK